VVVEKFQHHKVKWVGHKVVVHKVDWVDHKVVHK
jgi:hypothetical protein